MARTIDVSLNDAQEELCRILLRTGLYGTTLAECVERCFSRHVQDLELAGWFRDRVELIGKGQGS